MSQDLKKYISTGIFDFPKERAARIMLDAIEQYFAQNPSTGPKLVRLTLFDQLTIDAFIKVWGEKYMGEQ